METRAFANAQHPTSNAQRGTRNAEHRTTDTATTAEPVASGGTLNVQRATPNAQVAERGTGLPTRDSLSTCSSGFTPRSARARRLGSESPSDRNGTVTPQRSSLDCHCEESATKQSTRGFTGDALRSQLDRGAKPLRQFSLPTSALRLPPSSPRFPLAAPRSLRRAAAALLLAPALAFATPVAFDLPAQPLSDALLAFSQQAKVEVLFSADAASALRSAPVNAALEPEAALQQLLGDSGFVAQRKGAGKFVITRAAIAPGSIRGVFLRSDGTPARGVRVILANSTLATFTDSRGEFRFPSVPAGTHQLAATGRGFRPLQLTGLDVVARGELALEPQVIPPADELVVMEPFIVEAKVARLGAIARGPLDAGPRAPAGNLDLPRTQNDPLPYTIYYREQLERSGVTSLNDFFRREVLDSDATKVPGDKSASAANFDSGSTNLRLRGYGADETVVLVNGRRLPESPDPTGVLAAPDVNYIPLSLVQQVEVMPSSAAALYSGNAVGGVINIVLRPTLDATEVSATYTNTTGHYDAPEAVVSLQHGQTLLDGKLRLRFNATFARAEPATEAELGHLARRAATTPVPLNFPIYRATPNLRSADGSPLFGPGTWSVTSVAPGADGTGGLAAFTNRQGVRNVALFDVRDGLAASLDSVDLPYGKRQERKNYYGSFTYDVTRWLELGLDVAHAATVAHRGYDVLKGDLVLTAANPRNPFGQDVLVSLNETAPALGADYSEARLDFTSAVFAAVVKLPREWRAAFDAQQTRSTAKYRGIAGKDDARWQQLVDSGAYNPLRDTQVFAPPPAFYDRVVLHYGGTGHFATLDDYDTLDLALRVSNPALPFPTGRASLNAGVDFRRNHLAARTEQLRYGDGSAAGDPTNWSGRSLERYSVFGELQAPLLPAKWLPRWIRGIDADAAARYVASDNSAEANLAPAAGLKVEFPGGLALRGSVTTANRFPTPYMSRRVANPGNGTPGPGPIDYVRIIDPRRNENYDVIKNEATDPSLLAESAVTKTIGVIWQRGQIHRVRAALDLVDTRKDNELVLLDPQALLNLESFWPSRVVRGAPESGATVGKVQSVTTGVVNAAWRHSQNWNGSLDYAWSECRGGTLEAYGRWVAFTQYDRQVLPATPVVDELAAPDGTAPGLMKHRLNFGASWSNRSFGFGVDGRYFHSRVLPEIERALQGNPRVGAHVEFDAYVQAELARWLPWKVAKGGLRGQLRVSNLFDAPFPRYANEPTGTGLQSYGDWRGRVYSLSLTATF